MLGIKAERRLDTVALIGLNVLIARLLHCADGRCRMLNGAPKLSTTSGSFEFPFDVTA